MKITLVSVGAPSGPLAPAIREYEERASRYWKLETLTVDPEKASKNRPDRDIMAAEADRLREAIPDRSHVVALTRKGKGWSSRDLARYLNEGALRGADGTAFLIGGALGLDPELVRDADRRMSLSAMTLPHDMARLLLAEQLYRAGTIIRREPYHKG